MPLKENEKALLGPLVDDYLKARIMSPDKEAECTEKLESQVQQIRPDISPDEISMLIRKSEPNMTIGLGGDMQDLKLPINDMLENLSGKL